MSRRTTLTLDEDVAANLAAEARRSGQPLRVVVNATLRAGLEGKGRGAPPEFRVRARDMGLRPGLEVDDIEALIDRIEGPSHR